MNISRALRLTPTTDRPIVNLIRNSRTTSVTMLHSQSALPLIRSSYYHVFIFLMKYDEDENTHFVCGVSNRKTFRVKDNVTTAKLADRGFIFREVVLNNYRVNEVFLFDHDLRGTAYPLLAELRSNQRIQCRYWGEWGEND